LERSREIATRRLDFREHAFRLSLIIGHRVSLWLAAAERENLQHDEPLTISIQGHFSHAMTKDGSKNLVVAEDS
jgi:hypothetical protein